jgi:hypothetical protein
MIAQVLNTSAPVPFTDETRTFIAEVTAKARRADGCEGILVLVDPNTGNGLAINMFRDEAAAHAFDARRQELTKEAQEHVGATVGEPQHYEVFANL